jgi:hypothetical protein
MGTALLDGKYNIMRCIVRDTHCIKQRAVRRRIRIRIVLHTTGNSAKKDYFDDSSRMLLLNSSSGVRSFSLRRENYRQLERWEDLVSLPRRQTIGSGGNWYSSELYHQLYSQTTVRRMDAGDIPSIPSAQI